ncbi:MAG TPA: methylmalonyl Co-A mutase-associated GTPase MeaB [Deltaproteobacteria bacterium]|nr:methylmalonyl Co-A mutase-associated GTPase MeaB [Deltaproteobacteria bacterium]
MELAEGILDGSVKSLARLISWLEDDDERAYEEMRKLYPHTGNAYVIGITGSPGAGKSTLTDKLTQALRKEEYTVGIIAVDPSSPFTGGAVLGDRVRMSKLCLDPGVYIRSMATRGHLGGVAKATNDAVRALDAFGKDIIIIETVGVGQDEIDVIKIVDTTILVLVPGMGDVIQSMKAGVMEIADIFVINKADHPGADQLETEIQIRLEQDKHTKSRAWVPPVVKTIAVEGKGIEELKEAVKNHRKYLEKSGELEQKRKRRVKEEILSLVENALIKILQEKFVSKDSFDRVVEDIISGNNDPYTTAKELLKRIGVDVTIQQEGGIK